MNHLCQYDESLTIKRIEDLPDNKKPLPSRGISSSYGIWLQQKRDRDCELNGHSPKHWIIHGKAYDLTQFIPKHPGGSHWISYTQGHDITDQFIIHHLNIDKAQKYLNGYEVKDVCNSSSSSLENKKDNKDLENIQSKTQRFTFDSDGLYMQTRRRLLERYSIQQLQSHTKSTALSFLFFSLWFAALTLAGYFHSYWLALLCAYLKVPLIGLAHNFVHGKNSFFKYFFLVTGFQPRQWEIMHCISHHQLTNTLLDYELQGFEPIIYFIRIMPENSLLRVLVAQIIFIILLPSNIIFKLVIIPITKFCAPEWLYLIPLLQIVFLNWLGLGLGDSIKMFLLMHFFLGGIFIKLTTGPHRHEELWTEGCPQIKQFGMHIIHTTTDVNSQLNGGFWSYLLVAGFNIHTAHHMFPTIDNEHLYKAYQVLEEVCKQKEVRLSKMGLPTAILAVIKGYMGRKPWKSNLIINNQSAENSKPSA